MACGKGKKCRLAPALRGQLKSPAAKTPIILLWGSAKDIRFEVVKEIIELLSVMRPIELDKKISEELNERLC